MTRISRYQQKLINEEYIKWIVREVQDRTDRGFVPYLMNFMFSQIPGSDHAVGRMMDQEIERAYYLIVDRLITRKRTSSSHRWKLPFFFAVDDWPVLKNERSDIQWLRPNDGRHKNGVQVMPPPFVQRLKRKLDEYIEDEQSRFVRSPLARIHAVEITDTSEKAIRYALKSLESGRTTPEDLLVLPRSSNESGANYKRGISSNFSPETFGGN